ncbi:WD40 repeat domain-containing protein [Ruminococcus albus]|nr:WD40 repeat domain-containing protein [Ruminococcus albus]
MIILWDSGSGLLISMIPEDGDLPDYLPSEERSLIEEFRAETDKEDGSADNGKYRLTWSLLTNTAELCDTETGTCLTLSGHSKPVCSGGFSSDGRYCLTGSVDKTAKIWDTRTGKCLKTLSGHSIFNQAVVRSDGKYCITNSTDGSLKMWKLEDGKCIWQKEKVTVSSNYILKDNTMFNMDNDVYRQPVFSIDYNTKDLLQMFGIPIDEYQNKMQYLIVHEKPICSAVFLPDGKHYMICLTDGTLNEFDIETGDYSTIKIDRKYILSVVYSPNEKNILVNQVGEPMKIWDHKNRNIEIIANTEEVTSSAVSCDGKFCLTGSEEGKIQLWNINKWKCLKTVKKVRKGTVDSLAFSPDGKCFIAASNEGTAALRKINSGKLLKTFDLRDAVGTKSWSIPYVAVMDKNTCTICKFDCFDPHGNNKPEYINTLYNADRMHITNCSFKDITADDTTKEIIYQYGETRYISADETTAL